jgi:hypothetical protein
MHDSNNIIWYSSIIIIWSYIESKIRVTLVYQYYKGYIKTMCDRTPSEMKGPSSRIWIG